jgi:GGDEF domain-containing protein
MDTSDAMRRSCKVGTRIRDRAASGDIFARIGDDEFALCLAGADPETACRVACSLVEIVKKPVQIGIEHHSIGANVGIAQAGRGAENLGMLSA